MQDVRRAIVERAGAARRLGFADLFIGAFALLRTASWLWLAWLVLLAVMLLMRAWGPLLHLPSLGLPPRTEFWGATLLDAVFGAAFGAIALRAWLRPERGWAVDLGTVAYTALASSAWIAGVAGPVLLQQVVMSAGLKVSPMVGLQMAGLRIGIVMVWMALLAVLAIWPIAMLLGDAHGLARTLRLTGWAAGRWFLFVLLGAFAINLATMIAVMPFLFAVGFGMAPLAIQQPVASAATLFLALAALAVVYQVRMRGGDEVAAVFD